MALNQSLHQIGSRWIQTFPFIDAWWWCPSNNGSDIHGPFETLEDALEDAADPPECADCGHAECICVAYDAELEAKLDDALERADG